MRKNVEHAAIRLVLLLWAAVTVLVSVSGEHDGRLAVRVAAVLAAAILTVEGARWLRATSGPAVRPMAPLVRVIRSEEAPVPARLQSWVGLIRAAESDPHVGPLLRDRLVELARAQGAAIPVEPGAPLDRAELAAIIARLEAGVSR